MPRTVVIGVGGTGLQVIQNLRRRIVENHRRLDAFEYLRFLFIDTDYHSVELTPDSRKEWEVLGQETHLSPAEYAIIGVDDVGNVLGNLTQYKQIEPWFPADNLKGINQTAKGNPGASQIRPLGRMAFTLNAGLIKDRFLSLMNNLPNPPGGGKTKVVVVCSLSGGTGSGMFLDLAYSLRKWDSNIETEAFLILPSFTENRGSRYLANAYAALLELNYFSAQTSSFESRGRNTKFHLPLERDGHPEAPFDTCYLVSPRNSAPLNLSLGGLAEMVAHRLYLNMDSGAASWISGLMSNNRGERQLSLHDPFTGAVHSQNFCTFGLASIEYPIEKVTEILSYRLVEDVVMGWVKPRLTPPNVNQLVLQDIPDLWLTDHHLLGNLDLFGSNNSYSGIEQEVRGYVNAARGKAAAKRLAPSMSERYNSFAKEYRTGGVIAFYQGLLDNATGAVQVLLERVRGKMNYFLQDPEFGYTHALGYLTELIRVLEQKSAEFARTLQSLDPKTRNSAQTVNLALNQLNEADNKLVFRDRAVSDAMQRLSEAMIMNLTAFTESHAYNYACQLISALLSGMSVGDRRVSGLKDLRADLEAWRQAVDKLLGEIRTEMGARRDFLQRRVAASADFNGSLLYSTDQVDSVYKQLDLDGARKHIRDRVLPAGDVLGASASPDYFLHGAFGSAIQWLTEISVLGVAEKNVADQLLEEYPESRRADRQKLLADNLKNSMAFLQFDQGEKTIAQHDPTVGYADAESKHAKAAALMSDDQKRFPNVSLVRSELEKQVGLRPSQIRQVADTHQILFLHETAGFPLRLIRDVRALRDSYESLAQTATALPMHIQKSFEPPLMGLFITSDEERRAIEQCEESFLVGWVEGKLRIELNKFEERSEVRYRYREAGAEKFHALGWTRDEAFGRWMAGSADLEPVRQRLNEDIEHFRDSLDTVVKRREFARRLTSTLEVIKQEARHGEEDPIYLRYSRIRERVFTGWKLPEMEAAGAQSTM